ncbi:monofunctional biosynthetic peptidoglycan transglycosylase, partial [Rhizobium leguminosarum]
MPASRRWFEDRRVLKRIVLDVLIV